MKLAPSDDGAWKKNNKTYIGRFRDENSLYFELG